LKLVAVEIACVVFKLIPLIIKIPTVVLLLLKILHLLIQHLLLELMKLHLLLIL